MKWYYSSFIKNIHSIVLTVLSQGSGDIEPTSPNFFLCNLHEYFIASKVFFQLSDVKFFFLLFCWSKFNQNVDYVNIRCPILISCYSRLLLNLMQMAHSKKLFLKLILWNIFPSGLSRKYFWPIFKTKLYFHLIILFGNGIRIFRKFKNSTVTLLSSLILFKVQGKDWFLIVICIKDKEDPK